MLKLGFFEKEVKEFVKTPKLIVLLVIFLFFGITSPLVAKYMNELIALLAEDVQIVFPDPVLQDAWLQFFKNTTQLCLIVFLILMTGSVASEKSKGSILLVLTKKVSRTNFILSKFFAGGIVYIICYLVSLVFSGFYTYYLFDAMIYDGLFMSILMIAVLGLFYTALAILVSVLSKTSTIAALLGFAAYAVFGIFNMIKAFQRFNPTGANSLVFDVISGQYKTIDLWINLGVTLVATALILFLTIKIFKRQEL
jgi:ABC-2 type transport system permease protein